jgi:hypothetical protein
MGTVNVYRVRAVLDAPKNDQALLAFANGVDQKMTNNPNFTSPGTVLTDLSAAATVFAASIVNLAMQKDAAGARTAAKQTVFDKLDLVKAYVNGVVAGLPPDQAKAAVESAGLRPKKRSAWSKPPLAVKEGGVAGSVQIVALAAAKVAMYSFEYSTDQQTWTACPVVMMSRTTVTGLTVGTTYFFRFRAETRKGLGDWSAIVSFVVR